MRRSTRLLLWTVLWLTGRPSIAGAIEPRQGREPAIDQLVTAYFSTQQPDRRRELVKAIRERSGDDWSAVAQVLPDLKLWLPESNRTGVFTVKHPERDPVRVWFELPDTYDATSAHPVILGVAGSSQSPAACIQDARSLLGTGAAGFIFVSANRIIEPSFHESAADRTLDVVRAVRRRFHTDTDRWIVYGSGAGADGVWPATIMHPDLFAGFISIDGYFHAPYPNEIYRLCLPNLQQVRGLCTYSAVEKPIRMNRAGRVFVHDRVAAAIARDLSLPLTFRVVGSAQAGQTFALAEIESLRSARRARYGAETTHCFRYPWQGSAGWLRQTEFGGEVWTADQLSIRPASSADGSGMISDVLRKHLAYVGGRVAGQVIRIETRRCREIELRLTPTMVNLDKPVIVYCNDRRRRHGLIPRSIESLLTCAREEWEFQRPVAATIRISIRSDAE